MKKTIVLIISLLAICFVLAGCKSNAEKNYVIEFESNHTTGYTWQYETSEEGIVEIENNYITKSHDEKIVGVGGTDQFIIKGLAEGTITIKFTYSQSWDPKETDKTESYKITVDKDLNVFGEKLN